ncbi:hypothetical protein BD410DRAFT_829273 [Rickenella mellea]|uniref:Uncharacterized protein n=1 Tax=Rickenella mellea TaxID=50990 RepID=A0A4Y7Q167_9AGAM|nr:hypothetical protein BD410DRAFT_829273 [Rickenella mellea]
MSCTGISRFNRGISSNLILTGYILQSNPPGRAFWNIETNDYAACPNFSTIETNIITTEDLQEWDIKETGVKGRYVIYTTSADIDLFWGLTNGRRETQITLRDNPNTPSNQWELKDVSLWGVVGSLRANLADLREEQVGLQGEYAKLRGEHTELQDTHTKLQNEHMKLRDEYKKLQEHGKDPETKKLTFSWGGGGDVAIDLGNDAELFSCPPGQMHKRPYTPGNSDKRTVISLKRIIITGGYLVLPVSPNNRSKISTQASSTRSRRSNLSLPFTVDDEQHPLVALPTWWGGVDQYFKFSGSVLDAVDHFFNYVNLLDCRNLDFSSTITLAALPPTTTTNTPHPTTTHAHHPLLPASPSSPSQSARKDKVQAIALRSLVGCAPGAVIGWVGVGVWRSRRKMRNWMDVYVSQPGPFDEQADLDPYQAETLQANDNEEDKDTVHPRVCGSRGPSHAHRRERASLMSSTANIISTCGGGFLEAPQLSREPTRTAFSTSPNSTTPMPTPTVNTRSGNKRPVMSPAPTVFSSTASSYEYDIDGDEDDGDGGMGKKRGLLEKLKRWTGGNAYFPVADVGGRVGGKTRGRTPELEAGVLHDSPHQSLPHSDWYKSITHEQETSSLARAETTATNTTTTSTKTLDRGYGRGRAYSDVTIQLPVPAFAVPTNDADRDTYTTLPSRGQVTGANTRIGGMRRGVALVDPPVPVRQGYGLRLQDSVAMLDAPYSPDKAESGMVSQDNEEAPSSSNATTGQNKPRTVMVTGKCLDGRRKLKSTRRRGGGSTTANLVRDKTLPTPPAPPTPAAGMLTSTPTPTPRAVDRVLTRKTPGGARGVRVRGFRDSESAAGGYGMEVDSQ